MRFQRLLLLCMASVLATTLSFRAEAKSATETSGDVLVVLLPTVAYGSTFAMDDEEGRMQFYKSFFSTLAVTQGVKASVNKTRPDGSDNKSFPSGHSSASFQAASFIQMRYGWKYGIPAYLTSSYVAWTRVKAKKHFVVDVMAGASLGVLSNLIFTDEYSGVRVEPHASHDSYGVTLSLNW